MLSRESRKEARKRGSARRHVDLDDIVITLPPARASQIQPQPQAHSPVQQHTPNQQPIRRSPRLSRTPVISTLRPFSSPATPALDSLISPFQTSATSSTQDEPTSDDDEEHIDNVSVSLPPFRTSASGSRTPKTPATASASSLISASKIVPKTPRISRTPKTPRTPVQLPIGRITRSSTATPQVVLPEPTIRTPRNVSSVRWASINPPKTPATSVPGSTLRRSPRLAMPQLINIPDHPEESNSHQPKSGLGSDQDIHAEPTSKPKKRRLSARTPTKTPTRNAKNIKKNGRQSMTPVSRIRKRHAENQLKKNAALKKIHAEREAISSQLDPISEPEPASEATSDDEIEEIEENITERLVNQTFEKISKKHDKRVKARKKAQDQQEKRVTSIDVKYRRLPSNRARLLTIDVINQLLADYFSSHNLEVFTNDFESMNAPAMKRKLGVFMANYKDNLCSYFDSLIDLQLTNNLIIQDIILINKEKHLNRSKIFEIREERNEINIKLNEKRNDFLKLKKKYNDKLKVYKRLLALKRSRSSNVTSDHDDDGQNNKKMDLVMLKLDQLSSVTDPNHGLVDKLKSVNSKLKDLNESLS